MANIALDTTEMYTDVTVSSLNSKKIQQAVN